MKYAFHTILFLLLLLACGRETDPFEVDFGHAYFPLEVGRAWEYEVDSIIFASSITGSDSVRWLVREEVTEFFTTSTGDTVYRVERFERPDESQDWQIRKVVALSRSKSQATRTEDNLRFIKLVFPFREGANWDGNLHIDKNLRVTVAGEVLEMFKDWGYRVLEKGMPFNNGIRSFDDAVVVSLADSENLIERRFAREVYANGIGLVYLEQQILDTQCQVCCNNNFAQCNALPWRAKAEKGFIVIQRLTRWE